MASRQTIRPSRRRVRPAAALCLVMVLVLALAAYTGCGSSDDGAGEVEETSVGAGPPLTGGGVPLGGETAIEGGNADFSLEKQSIGEGMIFPDARIFSLSWSDQGDYLRIEFTMGLGDGRELTGVPNCNTWYTNEYYSLAISFGDVKTYQFDLTPFMEPDVPVYIGDPVVEYIQRKPSGRDEPVWFEVVCAHSEAHPGVSSRPHRLTYSSRPWTVILDIQKM